MTPGINLNVPEADYHAFPALSKSVLWKFAKNPHKWHATKDAPFAPTASMAWGSLVDCLILDRGSFGDRFAGSPFPDFRTKEAMAWRDAETREIVARLASLTPQQVRVLMMLGEGLLNKQIAYKLGVSEATVKAHVSAILQKLGVDSRTQAVIAINKLDSESLPKV